MKKVLICLLLVGCLLLTGCNLSYTNSLPSAELKSVESFNTILTALSTGDIAAAKALMYPEVAEASVAPLTQISEFLDGRKVTKLEKVANQVRSSTGTQGKIWEEKEQYTAVLEDETPVAFVIFYYEQGTDVGFTSVQLVLGAIPADKETDK